MPGAISSLFLIIVGAIARYAYSDSVFNWHSGQEVHSIRIDTIGLILLLAGIIGLLLSILWSFLRPKYIEPDYPVKAVEPDPPIKTRRAPRRPKSK